MTFSLCQAKEWFGDRNFINYPASLCIIAFILEQMEVYFSAEGNRLQWVSFCNPADYTGIFTILKWE